MKKRMLALILCLALMGGALSGCGREDDGVDAGNDDIFSIYASSYPIHAIASGITKDVPGVQLNCLMQPQDGCLRSYALSDWDFALLTGSADAVLIGGRGLESYESLLYSLGEDGPGVSSLLYNMELSSFPEGEKDEESHWAGENPHIYLKTEGALELSERIAGSLMLLDEENSALYAANLDATRAELSELQREILRKNKDLYGEEIILMNEALLYVAEEYGLTVEEYVERESGEAFYDDTLAECLNRLSSCESRVILIEKQAPKAFCDVLEGAGYRLARLDVMSTHPANDGFKGYMAALRENCDAIYNAFSAGEDIE